MRTAYRIAAMVVVGVGPLYISAVAWAQEGNTTQETASSASLAEPTANPLPASGDEASLVDEVAPRRITRKQKIIRYSALIGFPLVVTIYGQQTWDWGKSGDWKWAHEGWFGRNTYHGGADKMGHAWGCYWIMRGSHAVFNYTENGASRKVWYAATLSWVIGTGIEIGDAYNGFHGFSWRDIVANSAGVAMGVLMETVPSVDAFVNFSGTYWPTKGFRDYPDKTILNLEDDSSGWTYKLSFKPAGFAHLGRKVPFYVRYLMLDVGFYTRGYSMYDRFAASMDEDDMRIEVTPRKDRVWFMGVSLNVPEVVDALFHRNNSRANRFIRKPLKHFYLPIELKLENSLN